MIELKPCPFCGCDVEHFEDMGLISCMATKGGCGFTYNCSDDFESDVEKWNTRA